LLPNKPLKNVVQNNNLSTTVQESVDQEAKEGVEAKEAT